MNTNTLFITGLLLNTFSILSMDKLPGDEIYQSPQPGTVILTLLKTDDELSTLPKRQVSVEKTTDRKPLKFAGDEAYLMDPVFLEFSRRQNLWSITHNESMHHFFNTSDSEK